MKFINTVEARIIVLTLIGLSLIGVATGFHVTGSTHTGTLPNPGHDFSELRGSVLYTTNDSSFGNFWILAPRAAGDAYQNKDLAIGIINGATKPTVLIGNPFGAGADQLTAGNITATGKICADNGATCIGQGSSAPKWTGVFTVAEPSFSVPIGVTRLLIMVNANLSCRNPPDAGTSARLVFNANGQTYTVLRVAGGNNNGATTFIRATSTGYVDVTSGQAMSLTITKDTLDNNEPPNVVDTGTWSEDVKCFGNASTGNMQATVFNYIIIGT